MAAPIFTSKYIILNSTDNFFDLDLSYGSLAMAGEALQFIGSGTVDLIS